MIVHNRKYIPENYKPIPDHAGLVFEGVIFDVYQWDQLAFDGKTKLKFEKLKRPDSCRVIGILDDGRVLFNKEEQPVSGVFYDVPAGKHDNPKENEEEAAKRELLEETGFKFNNWKLIRAYQPLAKIDWICYTFVAWGEESQSNTNLDVGEKIETLKLSLEELRDLISSSDSIRMPKEESEVFFRANGVEDLKKMPDLYD
jgi:ADP-ribose pyrophosphatase